MREHRPPKCTPSGVVKLNASSRLASRRSSAGAITQGHTTKWQIAQQTSQWIRIDPNNAKQTPLIQTGRPLRNTSTKIYNTSSKFWVAGLSCLRWNTVLEKL
ncbi:uncharacterized protein PHALS_06982 [Plasmopara halstedii]|uniref:Uncharacterized protein n=1 Tax=Plasmopara halstedii TaxID=4781 RepID=A0A0P1B6K3_PLAHL|nr:uncharacterized protein PHALS_06982 [Plasmopara halstedii]CEG49208.1 hypothetical protein PHALS_06982 [Plasmopara halstedii]|eukprot:XP_024585577.1 hypothetical protein PHALS_06982 [Plasmopara halstedii]